MAMNRPSCAELLEVVREYLQTSVQPRLEGALAYENRVAVNVLRILQREVESSAASICEQERLRHLLKADGKVEELNAQLCERIARGDFAAHRDELLEHLYLTTLEKLAVDNPGYVAYQRALERRAQGAKVSL